VCGAVKSGRVKMARVEVNSFFSLISVWGRGERTGCDNIGYRDASV